MAYRSESRGFMYTAPPSGDDQDRDEETDAERQETPDLGTATGTTDANWTGTVPADD